MAAGDKSKDIAKAIQDAFGDANESVDGVGDAINTINKKVLNGGLTMEVFSKHIKSVTKDSSNLIQSLGELGSSVTFGLDFGILSSSANILNAAFKTVAETTGFTMDMLKQGIDVVDGLTLYTRGLNAEMFKTVASFGMGYSAAKQYSEYLMSSANDYANAEAGFINPAERMEALKQLAQAGVPLKNLNAPIQTAAGSMDLLSASVLNAKALGMELGTYTQQLSSLMNKQGMSAQDASERMAMFSDVSEETGLSVDKVSGSLIGLANQHSKLGLTVEFGRPILESFTDSLTNMGFGFENAIDLSETLSSSLVGLTSNYAAAYVTFQRGGLDMGGGQGALGASIGLRAKLSPTNKDQDQGQLAMDMAGAMRDTLASFTGGNIVTVQEAASSPELHNAFIAQTSLLKDLYNINDTGAQDRTLELLDQLNSATASGDSDLAKSLAENLQEAKTATNDTMAIQDRIAVSNENAVTELTLLNKQFLEFVNVFGGKGANEYNKAINSLLTNATVNDAINNSEAGYQDPDQAATEAINALKNTGNNTLAGVNDIYKDISSLVNLADDIVSGLTKTKLKVENETSDGYLIQMKASIDALSGNILRLIDARGPLNGRMGE